MIFPKKRSTAIQISFIALTSGSDELPKIPIETVMKEIYLELTGRRTKTNTHSGGHASNLYSERINQVRRLSLPRKSYVTLMKLIL